MVRNLDLAFIAVLALLCALFGCGGGSDSSDKPSPSPTLAGPAAHGLSSYNPPGGQITVGCGSDGSLPREDVLNQDGSIKTYGLLTYIARQNAANQSWLAPNWQINAVLVDGPGDGRYSVQFSQMAPPVDAQGYSLGFPSGPFTCVANMLNGKSKTPFTSASHELWNTLVESFGGPRICGPVSPLNLPDGITDATTRSYWSGGAPPYSRKATLTSPFPAVVPGGAVDL